ncbi:MAG: hypothetical protein WAT67_05000 [Candidatus Contendobacter sp.]
MIDPDAKYWFEYTDATGAVWNVDWVGIYRILRAYARAKKVLQHSHNETHYLQTGGYVTIAEVMVEHVVVDWPAVERDADTEAAFLAQDIWRTWLPSSGERTILHLIGLREDTLKYDQQFWKKSNDAWKKTLPSIKKTVDYLEKQKKGVEIVRDTSADILMVGATFLSGGWALGALGARSAIKGTARYAETEKVGFAVIEGVTQMVFGLAKVGIGKMAIAEDIGKGAAFGANVVVACFVEAPYELGMALGSGKKMEEAIQRGALKMSEPVLAEGLGKLISKLPWNKLAIPMVIKDIQGVAKIGETALRPKVETALSRRAVLEGAKMALSPRPALPKTLPQPALSDGYVPAERIIRNMIRRVSCTESGQYFPNIPPPPAHR